ncbi:MAG TPA: transcriptional regulator [Sulfurimonas sp. UBA10385]|nr:MAG TPA: transcriptional regulator [Sulfurimonas sp. UBA10385]
MNIYIIEDEGVTALFLKEIISDLGHNVAGIFDNGDALLTFLKNGSVDLIFMDININGALDGIQTATIVHNRYPDISFVYLTSYKDSQTIKDAQAVKPLGYLIKPVVESDLEAIMMVVQGCKQRYKKDESHEILFAEYKYNIKTKTLFDNGEVISLSKNELTCINTLILNKNSYISAEHLIAAIWKDDKERVVSLRELIYRLRKKLPNLPLHSNSNIGYALSTSTKT